MCQEGIEQLFSMYHNCTEVPKIYHANGGTDIPVDDDQDDVINVDQPGNEVLSWSKTYPTKTDGHIEA